MRTAFDLVRYQSGAAHLRNAATVIVELAEQIDAQRLLTLAPFLSLPDVQRLGYLQDILGESKLVAPLAKWFDKQKTRTITLRSGEAVGAELDRRWHVLDQVKKANGVNYSRSLGRNSLA